MRKKINRFLKVALLIGTGILIPIPLITMSNTKTSGCENRNLETSMKINSSAIDEHNKFVVFAEESVNQEWLHVPSNPNQKPTGITFAAVICSLSGEIQFVDSEKVNYEIVSCYTQSNPFIELNYAYFEGNILYIPYETSWLGYEQNEPLNIIVQGKYIDSGGSECVATCEVVLNPAKISDGFSIKIDDCEYGNNSQGDYYKINYDEFNQANKYNLSLKYSVDEKIVAGGLNFYLCDADGNFLPTSQKPKGLEVVNNQDGNYILIDGSIFNGSTAYVVAIAQNGNVKSEVQRITFEPIDEMSSFVIEIDNNSISKGYLLLPGSDEFINTFSAMLIEQLDTTFIKDVNNFNFHVNEVTLSDGIHFYVSNTDNEIVLNLVEQLNQLLNQNVSFDVSTNKFTWIVTGALTVKLDELAKNLHSIGICRKNAFAESISIGCSYICDDGTNFESRNDFMLPLGYSDQSINNLGQFKYVSENDSKLPLDGQQTIIEVQPQIFAKHIDDSNLKFTYSIDSFTLYDNQTNSMTNVENNFGNPKQFGGVYITDENSLNGHFILNARSDLYDYVYIVNPNLYEINFNLNISGSYFDYSKNQEVSIDYDISDSVPIDRLDYQIGSYELAHTDMDGNPKGGDGVYNEKSELTGNGNNRTKIYRNSDEEYFYLPITSSNGALLDPNQIVVEVEQVLADNFNDVTKKFRKGITTTVIDKDTHVTPTDQGGETKSPSSHLCIKINLDRGKISGSQSGFVYNIKFKITDKVTGDSFTQMWYIKCSNSKK